MEGKEFETNNKVTLKGEIVSEFSYSHEVFGKKFYTFNLKINRMSENCDIIPIVIKEETLASLTRTQTPYLEIRGRYRSYDKYEDGKNKLILSVLAEEVLENDTPESNTNDIFLQGFICKPIIYRKTPLERKVSDILIAVNRSYGKSDYIPCIAWGRNAILATTLEVGDEIMLTGRIQSRIYQKKVSEEQVEERIAYEVSINVLEKIY